MTLFGDRAYEAVVIVSYQVMSNSLWPHGLQHVRPLCPSLFHAVCSSSCPLSQWCHPTILSSSFSCHSLLLPSIFHNIRVFSNESVLPIRWPKYWNFCFSFSPPNEYSRLIWWLHWNEAFRVGPNPIWMIRRGNLDRLGGSRILRKDSVRT